MRQRKEMRLHFRKHPPIFTLTLTMTTPELDVYQTAKIARTTLKASRWIALGIILAIFITPQFTLAPFLAAKSAESAKVTLETTGVLTLVSPSGAAQYRQPSSTEIERLVTETYETTLLSVRFFIGFASFMAFLIFWFIFASPMLRELNRSAIAADDRKAAFEAEMLSEVEAPMPPIQPGN